MRQKRIFRIIDWIVLLIIVVWSFLPIFSIIISSFKIEKEIFNYKPTLLFSPVITNYIKLFANWPAFTESMVNSVLVTVFTTFVVIGVSLPAAYAYSRLSVKGLSGTALYLIIIRMFPPIVITIPLYPLLRVIGIVDNILMLTLIFSAFMVSLCVWIIKYFIDGVPKELEEAALIDGCSRMQSFWAVVFPIIMPGIISSAIFVYIFAWNEFLLAFIFTSVNAKTAPVLISEMLGTVGEGGIDWGTLFAATTIQVIPIMIFIWLIQKKLIEGMTIGSVKG